MNFGPGAGPAFLAMQMQEAAKRKEVGLWTVLEDPQYAGKIIEYNYDFGDGWLHGISFDIHIYGRIQASSNPRHRSRVERLPLLHEALTELMETLTRTEQPSRRVVDVLAINIHVTLTTPLTAFRWRRT